MHASKLGQSHVIDISKKNIYHIVRVDSYTVHYWIVHTKLISSINIFTLMWTTWILSLAILSTLLRMGVLWSPEELININNHAYVSCAIIMIVIFDITHTKPFCHEIFQLSCDMKKVNSLSGNHYGQYRFIDWSGWRERERLNHRLWLH